MKWHNIKGTQEDLELTLHHILREEKLVATYRLPLKIGDKVLIGQFKVKDADRFIPYLTEIWYSLLANHILQAEKGRNLDIVARHIHFTKERVNPLNKGLQLFKKVMPEARGILFWGQAELDILIHPVAATEGHAFRPEIKPATLMDIWRRLNDI